MEQDLLESMLDLSRQMVQTRSLGPLLDYAMREAIKLVNAERGFLVLLEEDGAIDFRVLLDADGHQLENGSDQISTSILEKVLYAQEPIVIRDALSDIQFSASTSVIELRLRSVMCVPLIAREVILGAIYVENRSIAGMFDEEDLKPLIFFANQAAVAIENAMLNDHLEARVASRTFELEQAIAQLEQSWMEAVEANRMRTALLGDLAHDIRAPLSVVFTALHMMQDGEFGPLNGEQDEWIGRSLSAVQHALALIQDMFDLAKIEMNQLELNKEPVDLNGFLKQVYQIGLALPWPDEVAFLLDLEPDQPVISMDSTRIQQVLLNLLGNALKFTQTGSVTLHAHSLDNRSEILIGVRDTGIGVEKAHQQQLFERFRQIDVDPARRRSGTGLGLAISRELVEMHGGQIWVESEPQQGADFQFTLPV